MWLDTIALGVLGLFTLVGGLRGALAAGLSVFCLFASYAVAIVGASLGGDAAAARLGVPGLLGPPLLGAGLFLATYFVLGLLSAWLRRREQRRRRGPRSLGDRAVGAGFGALRGVLVVLLLGLLAIWLDALRVSGAASFLPSLAGSRAAAVTGSVVEAGVAAAVDDGAPGGRALARLAGRPAESLTALQAVLEHPRVGALQRDALFWTYVENGAVDAALNQGSFYAIIHDDALRVQLADLGLIEADAAGDPARFREAAGEVLREVGPRIQGLRNDPAFRRLMEDPEVTALLRSGDTFALLSHEGFRSVVADVASR